MFEKIQDGHLSFTKKNNAWKYYLYVSQYQISVYRMSFSPFLLASTVFSFLKKKFTAEFFQKWFFFKENVQYQTPVYCTLLYVFSANQSNFFSKRKIVVLA